MEGGKQVGKHFRIWIIAKDKLRQHDITRRPVDDKIVLKDFHPTDIEKMYAVLQDGASRKAGDGRPEVILQEIVGDFRLGDLRIDGGRHDLPQAPRDSDVSRRGHLNATCHNCVVRSSGHRPPLCIFLAALDTLIV